MTDNDITLSDGTTFVSTFLLNIAGTDVNVHRVGQTDPETGMVPRVLDAEPPDGTAGLVVWVAGGFAGRFTLSDPGDTDTQQAVSTRPVWGDAAGAVVREIHSREQTKLLRRAVELLERLAGEGRGKKKR